MKILLLSNAPPEDIQNKNIATINNAEYFSKEGHDVFLATFKGKKSLEGDFQHLMWGNKIDKSGKGKKRNLLLNNSEYLKKGLIEVNKILPDIIFCRGGGSLYSNFIMGIFFSKLLNIPVVGEWIGSDLLVKNSKPRILIKKSLLSSFTINFVQSRHMYKRAIEFNHDAKIKVIPGKGIDTEFFQPKSYNNKLKDRINILYVGRLQKVKGLKYLIEAFDELESDYEDIRLTLVGDGPSKKSLIELTEEKSISNKVDFLEETAHKKLPSIYRNADIFVLPSLSEGLPNVILEAMASGLPIVATNVGGNNELIKSGKGGFITPPKNSTKLRNKIAELIKNRDLREKMGKYNSRFVNKYDQKRILQEKIKNLERINKKS